MMLQGDYCQPNFIVCFDLHVLTELQAAGVGCFIDNRFTASLANLAHADDIILLASSARAMRHMLSTCDNFGDKHNVAFNNVKSKCITFPTLLKACSTTAPSPSSEIGGKLIENVDQRPHLHGCSSGSNEVYSNL
jgi:hypothetical protein